MSHRPDRVGDADRPGVAGRCHDADGGRLVPPQDGAVVGPQVEKEGPEGGRAACASSWAVTGGPRGDWSADLSRMPSGHAEGKCECSRSRGNSRYHPSHKICYSY